VKRFLTLTGGVVIASCALLLLRDPGVPSTPPTAPAPASQGSSSQEQVAATPKDLADLTRHALQAGKTVRIEHQSPEATGESRTFWSRSLNDRDRAYARRQIARIRRSTDKAFDLKIDDPVERERRMTELFRVRAMVEAAETLLGEGSGFVTKGLVSALASDDEWHYWNLRVHYKDEGERMIYVPIPLARFVDVKDWRASASSMREFAAADQAYRWNSLDFTQRQQLVAAATTAASRVAALQAEIERLRKAAPDGSKDPAVIDLQHELERCYEAINRVPRHYDPTTLLQNPR
jgi:hypothetical protein